MGGLGRKGGREIREIREIREEGREGENCDTWKKNQCKVSCISTSGTSLSHTHEMHELEGKCIHLHCTFIIMVHTVLWNMKKTYVSSGLTMYEYTSPVCIHRALTI